MGREGRHIGPAGYGLALGALVVGAVLLRNYDPEVVRTDDNEILTTDTGEEDVSPLDPDLVARSQAKAEVERDDAVREIMGQRLSLSIALGELDSDIKACGIEPQALAGEEVEGYRVHQVSEDCGDGECSFDTGVRETGDHQSHHYVEVVCDEFGFLVERTMEPSDSEGMVDVTDEACLIADGEVTDTCLIPRGVRVPQVRVDGPVTFFDETPRHWTGADLDSFRSIVNSFVSSLE